MEGLLAIVTVSASCVVTVASFTWWLAARFRGLEKGFYRALDAHRVEDNERFQSLRDRMTKVESWISFREKTRGVSRSSG